MAISIKTTAHILASSLNRDEFVDVFRTWICLYAGREEAEDGGRRCDSEFVAWKIGREFQKPEYERERNFIMSMMDGITDKE
jgi:hypothetical protein